MKKRISSVLEDKSIIRRKIFFIVLGNFLCSLAINIFYVPNGLLSTGVGGLAIMINYITGLSIGGMVFLLNMPLLFIGLKKLDRKFMIYTGISIFIYSGIIDLTSPLANKFVVNDKFLAAVFGALFNGVGMGLMFRNDVCQGGFDILASILKKDYNMNIGTGLTIFNTTIITISSFKFGGTRAMYTLVAMYISYQILDRIQIGFSLKKNIIIISDNSQVIARRIMKDMGRGVTFLKGEGAYTGRDKKIIYLTITSPEIIKLKQILEEEDPKAFFTINEAVEVLGSGFAN